MELAALEPWRRPQYSARQASMRVHFVCFAKGELRELPLSRAKFGVPDPEFVKQADVRLIQRSESPEWFAGFWQKALGVYARQALGERFHELTEADSCTSVRLECADRPDLVPLQTGWAIARWYADRGASFILDLPALWFRTGEQVLALPSGKLDIQREIQLVVEGDSPSSVLLHSRGMCKFARPDLVAQGSPADRNVLAQALNRVAQALAEGLSPERVRLRLAPGLELTTRPFSGAGAEERGLSDAVELVHEGGRSLAGIAAELEA